MTQMINKQLEFDNLMKQFAMGVYDKVANRAQLPDGWQCFDKMEISNGFYAEAYIKNGQIVIAYRGTNDLKDFFVSDGEMLLKKIPNQAQSALAFYHQVEAKCKRFGYDTNNITITGHSLGGSLTQLVCSVTGCQGVTFNAYGVGDIADKFNVVKGRYHDNIRNYGNVNDWTFYHNLHKQIGKTYVIDTNKFERIPHPTKYHKIEHMGNLEDSEPYDMSKHHKFEKESMHPDRVVVVEDVMKRDSTTHNDAFSSYFLQQAKRGYTMWERDIQNKVASGEVYVHSYTREDGTHVTDYYRSRPTC